MKELSLHIMDIAENGVAAAADLICIRVEEGLAENLLEISIMDNGRGMSEDILKKVTDPFFTSRKTRRVGLGLSLLKAAAERCNGKFDISSEEGKGTSILAIFQYDHIDRAPLGDMANTMGILIVGNQEIDFEYTHIISGQQFILDTRKIRKEWNVSSLGDPSVYQRVVELIRTELDQMKKDHR